MHWFVQMLDGVAWDAVVKVLLHSLWQGALLASLAWGVLQFIRARSANLRYGVTVVAMSAVLLAAMATFQLLESGEREEVTSLVAQSTEHGLQTRVTTAPPPAARDTGLQPVPSHARTSEIGRIQGLEVDHPVDVWRWAAMTWLAGAALMLVRAGWMLRGAQRLRRSCDLVNDGPVVALVNELRAVLRILPKVRIAVGERVRVPAVFGIVWPIILMPLAMVNELSPAQMRMILAHELAHVRRHDFLINLVQLLTEAALFFNPAVWWLSRQVRIEREACCDAVAIRAAGGRREDYVRSLADVIETMLKLPQPGLGITPAASGEGDVVDRAARVLSPGRRPVVRLSWYSLLGTSMIAAVLLAGMWQGTQAAVEVAAEVAEQLLPTKERLEQVEKLQKEIGNSQTNSVSRDDESMELTGVVRTADGSPLPGHLNINVVSRTGSASSYATVGAKKDGTFKYKVYSGMAGAWIDAKGFAPAFSEMVRPVAGPDGVKKYPPVELVLTKGFTGVLLVRDAKNDEAVAGVNLTIAYQTDLNDPHNFNVGRQFVTDAEGVARLEMAIDRNARVEVVSPGYQFDRVPCKLDPNRSTEIKINPARPTTGVVVDGKTGKPVPAAKIDMLNRNGYANQTWYPHPQHYSCPPLGETDAAGRFTLNTLRDDSTHVVRVKAPGYAQSIVTNVRAGEMDRKWELHPPRPVKIEIRADEGKMPKQVGVSNPLKLAEGSHDHGLNLPVKVVDGVGIVVLEDPIPGTVRFNVSGKQVTVNAVADAAPEPVLVDLRGALADDAPKKTREVVVKFTWPAGGAEPKGGIRVAHYESGKSGYYLPDVIPIKNGEARVKLAVPCKFKVDQGELIGYWMPNDHDLTELAEGDEPFETAIEVYPAGAVHGIVSTPKGEPMTSYLAVSLVTVKQPPEPAQGKRADSLQPFNARDGSGRYLLSPVMLGGTYRALASSGERIVVSEEFIVDAEHPIHEIPLKFVEGITYEGRVLDPDGKPAMGAKVSLDYSVPGASWSRSSSASTGSDGVFRLTNVNPDAGTYVVNVAPTMKTRGHRSEPIGMDGKIGDVRLETGLTARGKLIEDKTDKPMPTIRIRLLPRDSAKAVYKSTIETETDQNGAFEVGGLEPIEYWVMMDDTYPPDAEFTKDEAGNVISVRSQGQNLTITGGQEEALEVRRVYSPWR